METLELNECNIENFDASQIVNSCIEEDLVEDVAGSISIQEKGIFGGGDGCTPQTWRNKFLNQLLISPWSCFYMANWIALQNTYNINIPFGIIQNGWFELVNDGKFIDRVGGKMSDGTFYALKHFNQYTLMNVRSVMVPFSIENITTALKSGSDFVFGLKYGSEFAKNEQDNGILENTNGLTGDNGHLVCGIKANTMDDLLVKYSENYHGVLKYDIILMDIAKYPKLFQNNLTYFTE